MSQYVLYVSLRIVCLSTYCMSHYVLYVSLHIVCLLTYCMSHYILYVSLRTVCLITYCMSHYVLYVLLSSRLHMTVSNQSGSTCWLLAHGYIIQRLLVFSKSFMTNHHKPSPDQSDKTIRRLGRDHIETYNGLSYH